MQMECIVPGIPRTRQTKNSKSRHDWQRLVRNAAAENWPQNRPPITAEISAIIVHYYTEATDIDVDGIGKLILDALEGAVIENDRLISQVILRKTNQVGLAVSNPTPILATALGSFPSFVYVRLGNAPDHRELPI